MATSIRLFAFRDAAVTAEISTRMSWLFGGGHDCELQVSAPEWCRVPPIDAAGRTPARRVNITDAEVAD